jgi:hypothetical protein
MTSYSHWAGGGLKADLVYVGHRGSKWSDRVDAGHRGSKRRVAKQRLEAVGRQCESKRGVDDESMRADGEST